jgi:hypothetical protein
MSLALFSSNMEINLTACLKYNVPFIGLFTQDDRAAVAELGQMVLASTDLRAHMNEATEYVAQTKDVDFCKVLELLPDQ